MLVSEGNLDTTTSSTCASKILAQEYFSKPMHALFRSYDLAAYNSVNLGIAHPILDLGCGNGAFGSVFCRIHGFDGLDFGMDVSSKNVRLAQRRGHYKVVSQGDIRALPFKTGVIRSILCNAALCCVHPGYNLALQEIARILQTGGQLAMTIPTPRFTEILLPTRLFKGLGLHRLAALYARMVNHRNGHRTLEYLDVWWKELARAGLKVEHYTTYFSGSEATWWSLFAMRPFQLFAIIRYLPEFIQHFAVAFTARLIHSVPRSIHPPETEYGYLLIIARKL
jgi:SAM-dependent methyltransferase